MADSAEFSIREQGDNVVVLGFSGDWSIGTTVPSFQDIAKVLEQIKHLQKVVAVTDLQAWDSLFMTRLFQCQQWCQKNTIVFDGSALPDGVKELLRLATAVSPRLKKNTEESGFFNSLHPGVWWRKSRATLRDNLGFIGELAIAKSRLLTHRANMRWSDFFYFVEQAGPQALGIITLISVLVGMILAYLGAVQLRLFGAEVYVANLVTVGVVREMGALMTAIIMAGRTGAAYAAQLGTMQTNEEIDAITTLGISPMEFLVLPRMLALVVIMPLLCLYSDVLGLIGGGIVATGMDISFVQYLNQSQGSIAFGDILVGVFKSLVFAVLIAITGCKAGLNCGRSSAAVGQATTQAVVTAIVWLVVADALINILFDKLGI